MRLRLALLLVSAPYVAGVDGREVRIVVVRMLSLGAVLGFSALVCLGLSPLSAAEGAHSGWTAYATHAKRLQFRPLDRSGPSSSVGRSLPRTGSSSVRAGAKPVFAAKRAGGRKAVPLTRGQELGLRFRPDERDAAYGQPATPPTGSFSDSYQSELHSQFRPTQSRRKMTYEELQAETASPQPMVGPAMPHPLMPPPLPGYGGGRFWPNR